MATLMVVIDMFAEQYDATGKTIAWQHFCRTEIGLTLPNAAWLGKMGGFNREKWGGSSD